MTHVLRVATLLATLGLVLGACQGAASPSASAPGTSPSVVAPSVVPSAEPSQPTEPSASIGALPSLDLDAAAQALEGIDSYRIRIDVQGSSPATVEGLVVRSPEQALDYTVTSDGETQRIVVIGDQAWLDAGNTGTFVPVPAAMVQGLTAAFDPVLLAGQINQPELLGGLQTVGPENKNGVNTTHYHLAGSDPAGQAASMPPDAVVDIWIADQGFLVSLVLSGGEADLESMTIDVTNINDPANVVSPPTG